MDCFAQRIPGKEMEGHVMTEEKLTEQEMKEWLEVLSHCIDLKEVKPLGHFDILVVYVDGTRRIFHGEGLWKRGKCFAPLKDIDFFNRVEIYESGNTIGWPDPEDRLQISPEWLYEESEPA